MFVFYRVKELNGITKGDSVENGSKLELSEEGNSSEEVSKSLFSTASLMFWTELICF